MALNYNRKISGNVGTHARTAPTSQNLLENNVTTPKNNPHKLHN